jgi:hypothetical protein
VRLASVHFWSRKMVSFIPRLHVCCDFLIHRGGVGRIFDLPSEERATPIMTTSKDFVVIRRPSARRTKFPGYHYHLTTCHIHKHIRPQRQKEERGSMYSLYLVSETSPQNVYTRSTASLNQITTRLLLPNRTNPLLILLNTLVRNLQSHPPLPTRNPPRIAPH